MTDLRRYTLEIVFLALATELPDEDKDQLRQRAEGLIAVAVQNDVRIEMLLAWIHADAPEKEWSLAEFRAWCTWLTREQS